MGRRPFPFGGVNLTAWKTKLLDVAFDIVPVRRNASLSAIRKAKTKIDLVGPDGVQLDGELVADKVDRQSITPPQVACREHQATFSPRVILAGIDLV